MCSAKKIYEIGNLLVELRAHLPPKMGAHLAKCAPSIVPICATLFNCPLYTSDAADE